MVSRFQNKNVLDKKDYTRYFVLKKEPAGKATSTTASRISMKPKRDCPHCTEDNIAPKLSFAGKNCDKVACKVCKKHEGKTWICLKPGCFNVRCRKDLDSHV